MTLVSTRRLNRRGARTRKSALAHLIMTLVLLLFTMSTLQAAPVHPATKLAADLAGYPVNPDGTVDVIIQFTEKPQARHFEMMASHGGKLKFAFQQLNGAAYRIPVKMLAFLENHPDVAYVSPDRINKAAWDDEIPAVMDNVVRQQYALDGSGVGIAVIDSGVYSHDDLKNASGTASRIVYSESFVSGDTATTDLYGHGTHVAGILAGNGRDSASGYPQQYSGLAPNANIINLRVLDKNGAGTDSQVIAAIQRAIQLKSTYNIRIINLSLGRPVYEAASQDPLCQAVESAWKAGIVVVVAAGNSGRDNSHGTSGYATIQSPGNDPLVITVGATKTNGTVTRLDDYVASYSSKGPTLLDHVVKPDLVAPGNRIVSLLAPSSYLAVNDSSLIASPVTVCSLTSLGTTSCITGTSNKYIRLSGTSMATPVVAGGAALMLQKDPTLTPDTIKARMMKTAWKGYPQSSWGYDVWGYSYFSQYDIFTIGAGYLDVYAALQNSDVASGIAASPTAVYNPSTGQATLSTSGAVPYGNTITWGSSILWGNSIVWGANSVLSDTIIWGNSIVWGQSGVSGNTIIWGSSCSGSQGTVSALSDSEDGEN
ncbi:MAG TPA: S8 family peptidase [Candidatus Angelobacter sp.]|nr:S8 family peptidase [Candidatus Angelobacter sp.]